MVAVITINYNLSEETIPCILSLLDSDYKDIKIFLVDNGSRDEDYNELVHVFNQENRIKLIRIKQNCGYVGGVNHGLKTSKEDGFDYYMVMNNDTIIDKHAIGNLVAAARRYNDNAIVSGKVYYYDHPDVLQHTGEILTDRRFFRAIYPGKNEVDHGQYDNEQERDTLDDVFWLIPRKILHDVGLYCEYFFLYAEQADYSLRAKQKGYKLMFIPEAKIWHKVSMTSGGGNTRALPICYWRGQGLFLMHYRHVKPPFMILLLLSTPLILLLKSIFPANERNKCIFAQLRGYFWGFRWILYKKPNNGFNPYLKR